MFKIYLKTAIRHLKRSHVHAVINITGLATGITAMLLAIMFWRDEKSYDRFHHNISNLYRITTNLIESKGGDRVSVGGTGQVQGPAFKAAVPELRSYTRVLGGDIYSNLIANNKTIKVRPLFVDNNFLEVFSFPMLNGNAGSALDNVESVVLTELTAKKFFNSTDVIGKTMLVDADPSFERLAKPMVISAVVKDPPKNSSLQFDVLYTNAFMRLSFEDEAWLNAYIGTFVVLAPDANVQEAEKKFGQVYAVHARQQLAESIKRLGYDPKITYELQPMEEIHFNPMMRQLGNAEGGVANGSDPIYGIIFMVIGGFILLMAAINFVNLNIAGSIKRSKEVGIRKIAGGSRRQIIAQFLIEASILSCVAFLLAVLLLYAALPVFNQMTGKSLHPAYIFSIPVLLNFMILLIVLILVTGLYPAFILSRFNPAEVLYQRAMRTGSTLFRKSLVVIQFTPAIFLMIATLVYYHQMNFLHKKNLGYNPSQVIRTSIYGDRDYEAAINKLKNEFAVTPSIQMFSFGSDGYTERSEINGKDMVFFRKAADEYHIPLLEIPIVAGRNFVPSDAENGIIVNQEFVRKLELEYAVGSLVRIREYDEWITRTIVGVVKDYHFQSLREPIIPMVMFMKKIPDGGIWLKVEQSNLQKAIIALQGLYHKAMPGALFEYSLLDEINANDLNKEKQWQKVITIGTILSFIICWLGLFGLAYLSAYQRIKEIGIRKVLGATLSQIIILLTGNFILPVAIAIMIASPLAGIAMHFWLQNYAYHVAIGPQVFLVAAVLGMSVTLLAVIYHASRAALSNPVESLRTE